MCFLPVGKSPEKGHKHRADLSPAWIIHLENKEIHSVVAMENMAASFLSWMAKSCCPTSRSSGELCKVTRKKP